MPLDDKKKNSIGIVTATSLNLRPEPSTANNPLGKIPRGTKVVILKTVNAWYLIKTADGVKGYVHGDYIKTITEDHHEVGFLHERSDLQTISLEPATTERIAAPTSRMRRTDQLVARTWNSLGGLLQALSDILGIDVAAAIAILSVESGGDAFGTDKRMIIRFENHIFWRRWGKEHPEIFNEHFRFDPSNGWQKHSFRADVAASWLSFHGNQKREWEAFEFARSLQEPAAMQSISMGAPQIMGFNHARIGYESVRAMFAAFQSDVRFQIIGLFDFFKGPQASSTILDALRRNRWEQFASFYNGPGQAARYGELIHGHYETFQKLRSG